MKTIKELADSLNGREYTNEIQPNEVALAKKLGFVVIFGASDDLIEFRGAIEDEVGCYDGGHIYLNKKGLIADHDECECDFCGYEEVRKKAAEIEALWCENDIYSWTFHTNIPHESFDVMEGEDKYCRGIVIDLNNL